MDVQEHANSKSPAGCQPPPRGWHIKARSERPPEYPARFPVPDELVSWDTNYPGYLPPYYVSPAVLANDSSRNPKGWADPEDISLLAELPHESFSGILPRDGQGRPLNPVGRTGIAGRGLLGKWGPNYAADPIITRFNRATGNIEMLAVQRRDNGQWAIPGGMVDKGEEVTRTLSRELHEETGVSLEMEKGRLIYRGYIDDPRNTDHSWMETTAKHLHLGPEVAECMNLQAGDDARAVRWLPLTPATAQSLYASHCALITEALSGMTHLNPFGLSDTELESVAGLLRTLREGTAR